MDTNTLLNGVIDMHVHTSPDVCKRTFNDLDLTKAAIKAKARAIVIKGHHASTVARATICNIYNHNCFGDNFFVMYGGLVLNYEAGGLNARAVKTALEMGAKVIWLPTVDAYNDRYKHGLTGGIKVTDAKGILESELIKILYLIKEYDAVLATGHISKDEIRCVVEKACSVGIKKIVITHPEYWIVDLSIEEQRKLVSNYNVILERCFMQPYKDGKWISNTSGNLKAIKELGISNTILSTDCGNPITPPWPLAMGQYLQYMIDNGLSLQDIHYMTQIMPAKLLGIDNIKN